MGIARLLTAASSEGVDAPAVVDVPLCVCK